MPQLLGQWKNLLDDVPADLSLVLQHVAPLDPLFLLALWYCTCVLLAVDHTCLICSGHGGAASLVPLIFLCIFPLLLMAVDSYGLDLEVSALYSYISCLYPLLKVGPYDLPPLEL